MTKQKVKVALVISGAVSLGSFESGVVVELLRAAQRKDSPIQIDVIGGASAGAITGATLAYYLTRQTGPHQDPDKDYPALTAWKKIDVNMLTDYDKTGADRGLLSRTVLLSQTNDILDVPTERMAELHANDVLFFMTLTSLHGKELKIPGRDYGVALDIACRTHSETVFFRIPAMNENGSQWGEDRVSRDAPADETGKDIQPGTPAGGDMRLWYKIFNYALTSAANAGAWPARRHYKFDNRPDIWWPYGKDLEVQARARAEKYNQREGYLYFTDGGTVDNRPVLKMLQHALGLRAKLDREPDLSLNHHPDQKAFRDELGSLGTPMDLDRMLLFVEPDPAEKDHSEDKDSQLTDPDAYEGFLAGSLRAFQAMQRTAPDYVDLKWVGQVNQQMVAALQDTIKAAQFIASSRALRQRVRQAAPGLLPDEPHDEAAALLPGSLTKGEAEKLPRVTQAVRSFFAWLAADENPLPGATLNRVVKRGKDEQGQLKDWRPLVQLQPVLAELRMEYRSLSSEERVQVERYLAEYLIRHAMDANRWIYVDRIAPLEEKRQPLARTLMHFGGFVRKEWMAYDYLLGQQVALRWMLDTFDEAAPEWAEWRREAAAREQDLKQQLDAKEDLRKESEKPVDLLLGAPGPLRAMMAQTCKVAGEYLERSGAGIMGRVLWFATRAVRMGLQGTLWRTIGKVLLGGLTLWLIGLGAMLARPFSAEVAAGLGYFLLGLGYLLLGAVGAAVLLVVLALVYVLINAGHRRSRQTAHSD